MFQKLGHTLQSCAQRLRSGRVRSRLSSAEANACVELAYRHYLFRQPDPEGRAFWVAELKRGVPLHRFFNALASSAEGTKRTLSGGEFALSVAEWTRTHATPAAIAQWMEVDQASQPDLLEHLLHAYIAEQQRATRLPAEKCWLMGTTRFITPADSSARAAAPVAQRPPDARSFQHTGSYRVSAIASLYKAGRFIESFLQNITSQTIFHESELIIINADSPEGEDKVIEEYRALYPNIVHRRVNYRISVYDAWNLGVSLARGRYLTNTNLDDLRKRDSFELQAGALDRHAAVDVVYQDVYYSFTYPASFDQAASAGYKSNLPPVTALNLLHFNSPHNAPMWRRKLHEELGLFDTLLASAADWEFWLRCLAAGKRFLKVNPAHVAYFANPEGISTRPDTKGYDEAREIVRRYLRKLLPADLLMPRDSFADRIGTAPDWPVDTSRYDVVQQRLQALGARAK